MIVSLAAGFAVSRLTPTPPLTQEGLAVLGVFLSSLMMWITISIDWPSLITLFLLGLLPHFGFPAVFRGAFGNVTVAFLLFTFVLVYPLSKTFFVRRCAVAFVTNRFARKGPWCFVSFLLFSVTFMGLFISPSVLFVAFMPFLEDIYEVLQIKKKSQTGNMLMLGTAFCISLSSGMTAIGHVWPTLAIGYYKAAAGIEVNQFQYMAVGIPTGLVLVLSLIAVFRYIYRPSDLAQMDLRKAMELKTLVPKTSRREVMILAVMALTVILWVGPSLLRGVSPWLYKSLSRYTTAMPPFGLHPPFYPPGKRGAAPKLQGSCFQRDPLGGYPYDRGCHYAGVGPDQPGDGHQGMAEHHVGSCSRFTSCRRHHSLLLCLVHP